MRLFVLSILLAASAEPRHAVAQDMDVPVAVQVPLFRKVLSFNRRLDLKARGELVIAVAYQSGSRESVGVKDEVVAAFAALRSEGDVPIRVIPVDIDRESLGKALAQHKPAAMYVTPMRAASLKDIAAEAATAQATTFTGVPRYIESGLAVSVRLLNERPKLMLNVTNAEAQGADFSSDLLRLAQVRR